jgi:hypothetical protein
MMQMHNGGAECMCVTYRKRRTMDADGHCALCGRARAGSARVRKNLREVLGSGPSYTAQIRARNGYNETVSSFQRIQRV